MCTDPVLDRGAPIQHLPSNPGAGWAELAGFPAREGVAGQTKFTGELFATDPVGQQVEGCFLQGRGSVLQFDLPSVVRLVPGTGRSKQT